MKSVELLWFENISPFHESIFSFPIIGRLSMRQMMILGIGAFLSWMLYQTSGNFISLIPIGVTMFLTLKKQKVMSIEMHLFLVLLFYFSGKKKLSVKNINPVTIIRSFNTKSTNSNLGLAKPFKPKMNVIKKEIPIREIYADPLKPIRLKIKLERIEGKSISNKQTQIVYDGNMISLLSTDNNGELEVIIIPQTLGKKKIQIFMDGIEEPVFEEILFVKSP
ncbi:hypothetical protein [Candidatus Nitrosotenuis sp. DW1]|uniref:hypothetical protein n=1 Tax=Candidatus Nitrosotenuis sp. DW1 TaxID=2259672 RepID=UPI0015CED419|nr:hypothetical protein [Candidatus Nitrosotenuis sp. DW1]